MIRVRRFRFDAKNSIAIMKEVQGYAEDKELDAKINEAVDKKLTESNRTEGQ